MKRWMRWWAGLVAGWLLGLGAGAAAAQTRGVALVIGNAGYADRPLSNTVNDAADIAAVLREARFEVMLRQNLGEAAIPAAA